LFDLIERGHNPAVTSIVTMLELLVQPYRDQKEELAQKIFGLVSSYPGIEWVPVTMNVADRAAELRGRYRLSTPDAYNWPPPSVTRPHAFMGMIGVCCG
jgi:predicted nucleic acid-binding protein